MKLKDMTVKVKAGPDSGLDKGQFTAYASVFGNVDSYGDVVQPGAFAKTLADWKASGNPIPVLWGHDMTDPYSNIGWVTSAEEDDKGLLVTAQLDLDNPKAQQVYRLLKGGRVNQMSFAYDVVDGGTQTQDGNDYYSLNELKLYEVSVVPIGANQETEILAVKANAEALAASAKAGRVLAQKHLAALKSAHEAIGAVIAAADDSTDPGANDQEKASGHTEAKSKTTDEEPTGQPAAKSNVEDEEPRVNPSAKRLAADIRIYALMGAEGGS
jgi:HK97 family phage prohead protease